MTNRLLRYEATLVWRTFTDAFNSISDRVLLVATLVILVLSAPHLLDAARLPRWLMPCVAAGLSFGWQRIIRARLQWLGEMSPLAPEALDRRSRLQYWAITQAPLLLVLLGVAGATAEPEAAAVVGLTAFGFWAGVVAAFLPMPRWAGVKWREREGPQILHATGQRALVRAIISRQTLGSSRPEAAALAVVAAVFLLTAGIALAAGTQATPAASAAIATPALLCLLLGARLDPELLGFLPYVGCGPGFAACAVTAFPLGSFAAAAAAITLTAPPQKFELLLLLSATHLVFATVSIFRAWLYPGRGRRSAEVQVQIELAGLLLVGVLLPPLAVAALIWRMTLLVRHHRALRWIHP